MEQNWKNGNLMFLTQIWCNLNSGASLMFLMKIWCILNSEANLMFPIKSRCGLCKYWQTALKMRWSQKDRERSLLNFSEKMVEKIISQKKKVFMKVSVESLLKSPVLMFSVFFFLKILCFLKNPLVWDHRLWFWNYSSQLSIRHRFAVSRRWPVCRERFLSYTVTSTYAIFE